MVNPRGIPEANTPSFLEILADYWKNVEARNRRAAVRQSQKAPQRATDPVSAVIGPHATQALRGVGEMAHYTDLGDPQEMVWASQALSQAIGDYGPGSSPWSIAAPGAQLLAASAAAIMPGISAKTAKLIPSGLEGLKTAGGKVIGAPPGVKTAEDVDEIADWFVHLARRGEPGRRWYEKSGKAYLRHTGDLERARDLAAGTSVTSPQTEVLGNAGFAIKGYNQQQAGLPIYTGRYPKDMSARLERWRKTRTFTPPGSVNQKTDPFVQAIMQEIDPNMAPDIVVDFRMLQAAGFPNAKNMSPTAAQTEFVREMTRRAMQRLNQGINDPAKRWTKEQTQAAIWTTIKADEMGKTVEEAAADFEDVLARFWSQQAWESVPGEVTDPAMSSLVKGLDARMRQAFHEDIKRVILNDDGTDRIIQEVGGIAGESFDAPGFWKTPEGETVSNLGTKSRMAVQHAGTGTGRLDEASKQMMRAAEIARARVLKQDGAAGLRAIPDAAVRAPQRRALLFDMGQMPTSEQVIEFNEAAERVHKKLDLPDNTTIFAEPTPDGFVIVNTADLDDQTKFHAAMKAELKKLSPPKARVGSIAADSFYDWIGDDEAYRLGRASLPPDLQRRVDAAVAKFGPEVEKVHQKWQKRVAHFEGLKARKAAEGVVTRDQINQRLLRARGPPKP